GLDYNTGRQRNICTYHFSQVHLELLFNSIRASGGCNNNPSTGQFHAIFHFFLMVRCGTSPSASGNVVGQDAAVFVGSRNVIFLHSRRNRRTATPFLKHFCHSYLPTRLVLRMFGLGEHIQETQCGIKHMC
ncbi:hypothetical protein AMECASPLE_038493, partial [Ameca splendens]